MSLNEPFKIITLASELNELLQTWNISISNDNQHTLNVKNEDVSVSDNSQKELDRSVSIADSDRDTISVSLEKSESLLKKGEELLLQVEPVLTEAEARYKRAVKCVDIWKQHYQNSSKWLKIATEEYDRAVKEYNKAVDEYNDSLPALERASRNYDSCLSSQTRDKNGNVSPSCSSQREEYERRRQITERLKAVMEAKKAVMERAKAQYEMASEAYSIANKAYPQSENLLQRSVELLDMGKAAHRNASDAISAAQSALELDKKAQKHNNEQDELNDASRRSNDKVYVAMGNVHSAFNKILDYSESCEKFNVLMMSDLEAKSNLLYRFAKIQPDEIFIKDNKD